MLFFKKEKKTLTDFFPKDFVDIHSHLLPGIDDGAKDLNNSIALISKMRSYGIKNFITTPHVLGNVYPNSSKTIKKKLEEVKEALINSEMNDVSIKASAEYMLDEQFSERLKNDDILTLKDNYILVEMSFFNPPINLYELLFEIQLKGYKLILAHPERYGFYHHDFNNYYKLKKAGCLFQLNLLSLTEQYGKNIQKISKQFLKEGLYDFAGTDVHNQQHLESLKKIGSKRNQEYLGKLLVKNSIFQ